MPVSAHTLQLLLASGITGQDLVKVVASIDADMASSAPSAPSASAYERRKEWDRERKREARAWARAAAASGGNPADIPVDNDADSPPRADTPTSTLVVSTSEQDPPKENPPTGVKRKGSETGTRIPADWQPDLEVAKAEGLSVEQAEHEAARFRDYWRGIPGHRGRKIDWLATWRNWCRKAVEDMQRGRGPPQRQQSRNGLAAVVRKLHGIQNGKAPDPRIQPGEPAPRFELDLEAAKPAEPRVARSAGDPAQSGAGGFAARGDRRG